MTSFSDAPVRCRGCGKIVPAYVTGMAAMSKERPYSLSDEFDRRTMESDGMWRCGACQTSHELKQAWVLIESMQADREQHRSEVERLRAENAKLREVAQRVVSDFPPYQEIEHVDNGPDDPKEVPTGELLCGSCAQGLDDHDAHCLYAMAERALDNGVAPTKEDSVEPVSDESTIGEGTR